MGERKATTSPSITCSVGVEADGTIGPNTIKALQNHYGLTADGRLDGPSETIKALQNEISQYVG